MPAFVAEMWRLVRPGGVLAITTWGPGLFEPANGRFWDAVGEVAPSLYKGFNPWDEITTPAALSELFASAGVAAPAGHRILAHRSLQIARRSVTLVVYEDLVIPRARAVSS